VAHVEGLFEDGHRDAHFFSELPAQRGFVGFSRFHPATGELPQQRHRGMFRPLGDEELPIILNLRGNNADVWLAHLISIPDRSPSVSPFEAHRSSNGAGP
jgi:hypothetical protein